MKLSQIIRKGQKRSQLIVAYIGSVIGLFLLIGSIQLYLDYTSVMFGGEDLLKDGFLVDKKVSEINTITGGIASFTDEEIKALEDSRFVEDLAPVRSSKFKVGFKLGSQGSQMNKFLVHYYSQSIPERFLNVEDNKFSWSESDSIVPIVVPTEFVKAFNNFAPTQGIPQISEETLRTFPISLVCEGNGFNEGFKAQIVGFTGKMNTTVLVPDNFLEYANAKFGDHNKKDVIQSLFIITNSKYHHEFLDLMEKNNFSVNEAKLKASEEKSRLQIILSVMLGIGSIILIQSALNFILYSQLSIFKNEYEIGVLTNIGYDYKTISKTYIFHFAKIFVAISITAFVIAIFGKMWLNGWAQEHKIPLEGSLAGETYVVGLIFLVAYIAINSISIFKSIKEIAKRN